MERRVYTVSELTREVKLLLERRFPSVWVKGEVSNITTISGHTYFTLKDDLSQISCVLFRSAFERLLFIPKIGEKVVINGVLTVYEKRGQYQIIVEFLEPIGKGTLWLSFERLKEKLKREGLFDPSYKKQLPFLIERVAVITSTKGAAIRDILRTLPDIEIVIFGVKVQGESAKDEIVQAIEQANQVEPKPDVIIIGRGGGSLEDLWPFNEEAVARAIFSSEIPIISAVGHETDYVISDMVADIRAQTPTAAGQMIAEARNRVIENAKNLSRELVKEIGYLVQTANLKLQQIESATVFRNPYLLINAYQQQVDDLFILAERAERNIIKAERLKIGEAIKAPYIKMERYRQQIEDLFCSSKRAERSIIHSERLKIRWCATELDGRIKAIISSLKIRLAKTTSLSSLDPKAILQRGYSITYRKDGSVVKSVDDVRLKEDIKIQLAEGEIEARTFAKHKRDSLKI